MVTLGILCLLAASPRESIEVIGFSANEKLAAWRVHVAQPQADGFIDFYTLTQVVDARDGSPVASFRASRVRRTAVTGRESTVRQRELVSANPRFAAAQSQSAWARLMRRALFERRPVRLDHPSVRLIPDRGLDLRGNATRAQLQIEGAVRGPVAFTAVAHLKNGRNVEVGHFSHDAPESGRVVAYVRAHTTKSRRGLLVHATFVVDDGAPLLSMSRAVVKPLDKPLDVRTHHVRARRHQRKRWDVFDAPWATADQLWKKYAGGYAKSHTPEDNGIEPFLEADFTYAVTNTDFPW